MKKKIAFIHFNFPCGGAERVTIDIADYIVRFDYEVYVFAAFFDSAKMDEKSIQDFNIKLLPDQTDFQSIPNADYIARCINDLSINVFVLPAHDLNTLEYIKNKSPLCKFVFAHHGKPLWEIEDKEERVWRRAQKNAIGRLKWLFIDYFKYRVFKFHRSRYLSMYRKMYNLVDAYVVLCEGYAKSLIEVLHLSAEENKLIAINNSEKKVLNPNLKKKQQLLYVGRLGYTDKRVDRLLDIWKMIYQEVPDWELLLVGDGEERNNLQERAISLKLRNLCFMGYRSNVSDFYRDASILCLTSSFEGWPLCLTEAQANGVVPIAFCCSEGVKEILSPNGENGFIIPPFNKKKYAERLLDLMRNSEHLEPIRLRVIEKSKDYSVEIAGKKWLRLFDSLSSS